MAANAVVEAWTGPGRRDGTIRPVPLEANGARRADDRRAFEHWYFDARLDDGHVVVGFLQTAELVSHKPGVELHVYRPDGTRREVRRRYPRSAAWAARDRMDVRIGHNHAAVEAPDDGGLPVHRVHLAEEDLVFDLELRSEVPAWQPGEGRTRFGSRDEFAWVVGAPRARVSGTVRIDDQVIPARGVGYHDHNWGVGDMRRIVDHWYWGRVYAEDLTVVYAAVYAQKRFGSHLSSPFMLAHEDRILVSTGEVEIETGPEIHDEVAHIAYPSTLELRADGVRLRLEVRDVIHAHCLLDDVPVVRHPIVQPLVRRLVSPGYFRFRSHFTIEADVDGERTVRTGSTLHEMVALK